MTKAAQRIVQLSGLGVGTAGAHLIAISQSGETAGERLLSYSSLSSGTAAEHLLSDGAVVAISGTFAGQELPDDLSANGTVRWAVVSGELHVTEAGHDLLQGTVSAAIAGPFAGHEFPDIVEALGQVTVNGQGALVETVGQDGSTIFGQNLVQGVTAVVELGIDELESAGGSLVSADLLVVESGQDSGQAAGRVLVAGVIGASEVADSLFAVGRVDVRGELAGEESVDVSAVIGGVLVQGPLVSQETGQDGLSGFVQAIISGTSSSVEESAEDTLAGQATFGVNLTLSVEQALLLQNIYSLHGLLAPLEVSTGHRKAGEVYQEVSTSGQTTTITTVTAGSDTLHQSVGVMIEELAALHGVTAPLKVDFTSRSAGQLVQTLSKFGGVTTVTRQ